MHKNNDISYEEIFDYIDEYNDKENEKMHKFREDCQRDNIPIIKKDVENFLRFYLNIIKPEKILEIGCAVGYSSIFMSQVLSSKVKIDTLEISDEMAEKAQKNFNDFEISNINIITGDALSTIPTLTDSYDMAFIDASKGHYDEFYNLIQGKMKKNSNIICDNMLFKGYLCMDKYQIPKRFKTIYKNMNIFLENIKRDKSITYNLLPLGDGLLVINKERLGEIMKKIELLAPAGDLEKLKTAIIYGADAVYIGGEKFGLRAASKNFTDEEMREGIEFAHSRGKKVYVTCNIIPHNMDFNGVEEYFKSLEELGVDAIIIADPSFLSIAKSVVPNMELHLSTQANTTNYMTAQFWHNQGIQRIVSARELSMKEIKQIKEKCPTLEIEMFVHGAMCISYSGRCLMSNFMTNRDANKGACSQPCRWNYSLVEEKRPGEYFPVEQDERGTYFFNSKDLCLIEHIDEIISSGVDSMKIEGRMKTAYYVAVVVRAYRMAIDEYYKNPQGWTFKQEWLDEVKKASYRDFTTAFYDGKNDTSTSQNYGSSSYIRTYDIIGNVISYDKDTKICRVRQKNRFFVNDEIEIIGPSFPTVKSTIKSIKSLSGEEMDCSNIPMQEVFVDIGDVEVGEHFILRKQVEFKES